MEGLNVATRVFAPYIVPISIGVLIALFSIQSRGTASVGRLFGPVIVLWFFVIGLLGAIAALRAPAIFLSLNPWHAASFLARNSTSGFFILGSVFLAVTGAEVLYADMGHFGKRPIKLAWFFLVLPGLVLNYMGQGAYLIGNPGNVENLFYRIAPPWLLYPLVALATAATVIASQAVISGAFSLARQSVQLGFWPRIWVRHTSPRAVGQVYVPFANACLLIGTVGLILGFRESGRLAGAYGIAVSATMLITTVLITYVARKAWKVPLPILVPISVVFLAIDVAFFSSNVAKILSGGWIVLLIALAAYLLMKTWRDGRDALKEGLGTAEIDFSNFVCEIQANRPARVSGTAVFLCGNPGGVPRLLLHNLKHNKVLHATTVVLSVKTEEIPRVAPENRVRVQGFGEGLWRILLSYGFSEDPDVPVALAAIAQPGLEFGSMDTTFFLGRETIVMTRRKSMTNWRKGLFRILSNNALDATYFFHLPPNRVVELGAQVEL